MSDRWAQTEPGLVPGGLLVRITDGQDIIAEHALVGFDGLTELASADAEIAEGIAEAVGECRTFVYDGDSGDCIQTIVVYGA